MSVKNRTVTTKEMDRLKGGGVVFAQDEEGVQMLMPLEMYDRLAKPDWWVVQTAAGDGWAFSWADDSVHSLLETAEERSAELGKHYDETKRRVVPAFKAPPRTTEEP